MCFKFVRCPKCQFAISTAVPCENNRLRRNECRKRIDVGSIQAFKEILRGSEVMNSKYRFIIRCTYCRKYRISVYEDAPEGSYVPVPKLPTRGRLDQVPITLPPNISSIKIPKEGSMGVLYFPISHPTPHALHGENPMNFETEGTWYSIDETIPSTSTFPPSNQEKRGSSRPSPAFHGVFDATYSSQLATYEPKYSSSRTTSSYSKNHLPNAQSYPFHDRLGSPTTSNVRHSTPLSPSTHQPPSLLSNPMLAHIP